MILEDLKKERLAKLLIDVVHAMVMYTSHKQYIRELVLRDKPILKPDELAIRLNMTLGEVLVILHELEETKNSV